MRAHILKWDMRLIAWIASTLFICQCAPVYQGPLKLKPISTRNGTRWLGDFVADQGLPSVAFDKAFDFYDSNQAIIKNQKWISVIDFTLPSSQKRFFVLNLDTGLADSFLVAHGEGSDPENTGLARQFSNIEGSLMSSLGFFLVNESYIGRFGISARLDGLNESNSAARERAIVLHGFDEIDSGLPQQGRTQGCPAVELRWIELLVNRLHGKSLLYAYIDGM